MNNTQKLKLKNDIVFKAFFSKRGNERFLKDFLDAVLEENVKIKQVKHDARLEQIVLEEKYGILDLEVELSSGEIVDIEMQLNDYKNIEERTTFYASKKITEQRNIGRYYKGLKKVIIIALLDYNLFELQDYVTKTVRVLEKHRNYKYNNFAEYYYIELKKFRENISLDMKEKVNQWLAFIDGERGDLIDMAKKESKIIKEADEEYNVLTGEEEVKRLAEIRMLSEMEEQAALKHARTAGLEEGKSIGLEEGRNLGLEEGRNLGLEEGKILGIKEEKISTAKKMLKIGIEIELIEQATGLTKEEILK